MDERKLDEILVRQKNTLLTMIDNDRCEDAGTILQALDELWKAAGYEYKIRELRMRIRAQSRKRVLNAINQAEENLSGVPPIGSRYRDPGDDQ